VQEFPHAVAVTLTALHGIVVLGMVTALSIVIVVLLLRRGQHLEVAMVASLTGASYVGVAEGRAPTAGDCY
jgi:hypothetical protein